MPRIQLNKERLEGLQPLPDGLYTIRCDGFEPEYSSNRDSINLYPKLVVVNHPQHNGFSLIENLNTKADWIILAFCHAFGVSVGEDLNLPGEFNGPDNDPTKWQYVGPLLGQTAQVLLKQCDNTKGRMVTKVDQYLCKLGAACKTQHPTGLAR